MRALRAGGRAAGFAVFAAAAAAAGGLGCGACSGSGGRDAAAPDGPCAGSGRMMVAGACVGSPEAAAFCGPAARVASGRCELVPCAADELLDRVTGACVTPRELRDAAARDGITMLEGDVLHCPDARYAVIVEAGAVACVPADAAAPRGAGARPCSPGTAFDETTRTCATIVERSAVDLPGWSAVVLGRDGGRGTRALCGPLATAPARVGLTTHGTWTIVLVIDLDASDDDVTALDVRVRALDARGAPLSGPPLDAARRAVTTLTAALDDLGRTTTTTHVSTRVRCAITDAMRPVATPRSGDGSR